MKQPGGRAGAECLQYLLVLEIRIHLLIDAFCIRRVFVENHLNDLGTIKRFANRFAVESCRGFPNPASEFDGFDFGFRFKLAPIEQEFCQAPMKDEIRAGAEIVFEVGTQFLSAPSNTLVVDANEGLSDGEELLVFGIDVSRADLASPNGNLQ